MAALITAHACLPRLLRFKVLHARLSFGGRAGMEPLNRDEIEELCAQEVGLQALEDGPFKP